MGVTGSSLNGCSDFVVSITVFPFSRYLVKGHLKKYVNCPPLHLPDKGHLHDASPLTGTVSKWFGNSRRQILLTRKSNVQLIYTIPG